MGGFNYNGEGATNSGLSSPSASDVANQFNSFGGTQIRASDVSNIRSDGNGGYMADIRGQIPLCPLKRLNNFNNCRWLRWCPQFFYR
jgi:hypothetical protein